MFRPIGKISSSPLFNENRTLQLRNLLEQALKVRRTKSDIFPNIFEKKTCAEYNSLSLQGKHLFLRTLTNDFGLQRDKVHDVLKHYMELSNDPKAEIRAQANLTHALVPPYMLFFQNIQQHAQGLKFIVDLRADILELADPQLKSLDDNLKDLLSVWFGIGHLNLSEITWSSPASTLERMAELEAVHKVNDWMDMKQRLGVARKCYALFHKSMPLEPLAFIYAVLSDNVPDNVQRILKEDTAITSLTTSKKANCVTFYSITSSQKGLSKIDLGNLLIKKSVNCIMRDAPNVDTICTLSPLPKFSTWLKSSLMLKDETSALLLDSEWIQFSKNKETAYSIFQGYLNNLSADKLCSKDDSVSLRPILMRLACRYLLYEKRRKLALDPVQNFHLKNGAAILRLNWNADTSSTGIKNSFGMMVNYQYLLDDVDKNNEAYIYDGNIKLVNGSLLA